MDPSSNEEHKSNKRSEYDKYDEYVGDYEIEVQLFDLFEDDVYELEEKEDVRDDCEVQVEALHYAFMSAQAMLSQVYFIDQMGSQVSDVIQLACQCQNSQVPEIVYRRTKGQSLEYGQIHMNIHSFLQSKDENDTVSNLVEPILCIEQQVAFV